MDSEKPLPTTFAEVIELWPTAVDLANDIGQKEVTVRQWKRRGIPAEYWTAIVQAAERRNFTQVTYEMLARLAAAAAGRPDTSLVGEAAA